MNSPHRIHPALILVVLSTLMFAAMDACSKYLGTLVPATLIVWVRFTLQSVFMGMYVLWQDGRKGFRVRHPGMQILRGALIVICSTSTVIGLRYMPLAELTAILMLSPVLVTIMAGWMLKESVGWRRMLLVLGGFVGTLMVIRPGSALFGMTALIPLFGMVVLSGYHLVSGYLAARENPVATQFFTGLTGSALLLPVLALQAESATAVLSRLSGGSAAALVFIGMLGTVGYLLLSMAFKLAETASLMPFIYSQIGFAALIGLLVFGHTPDFFAWGGMAVITLCGTASALAAPHRKGASE